jgi:DNA-binding MarR family transcriptional regulator
MATQRSARLFLDLWSAARRSVAAVAEVLEAHGIGDNELAVLLHLEDTGPLTVTALAQEMGVAFMTASDAVARLERDGDVRRESNPRDRRSNLVALTPAGKRRAAAALKLVSGLADDVGGKSRVELEQSAVELREAFEAKITDP